MKMDSAALFQHYYKLTVVNRGKKKNLQKVTGMFQEFVIGL